MILTVCHTKSNYIHVLYGMLVYNDRVDDAVSYLTTVKYIYLICDEVC